MDDYYKILGLSKDATEADIKSAYRKLAKKYHPDMYANATAEEKKNAEEKMKEVNQAYSVLSDGTKKANYDRYGNEDGPMSGFGGRSSGGFGGGAYSGGFGGFGFEDILNNIFNFGGGEGKNGNSRYDGDDVTYNLGLTFKEAMFGCEKEITINRIEECASCKGTGAKNGTEYEVCKKCNGTGKINVFQNTAFGRMQSTRICDECKGTGKKVKELCKDCGGKGYTKQKRTIKIKVPAGVDNGQMMTYYNEGDAGRNGGRKGNLIIVLNVAQSPMFIRKGSDLYITVPITFTQAALGCKLEIPTLTDAITYTIPEGTATGTVFRIRDKGVKILKREAHGDLYVTVVVETPQGLSAKQKELLINLNTTVTERQYPKQKAFYDNAKKNK